MKYLFGFLLVLFFTPQLFSQKGKTPKVDAEYLLYKKAMQFGDFTVARTAVLQLIVKYPEKPEWKDTLVSIYGMMGMYEQSILLGEDILKTKTTDTNTLKIVAVSYENLGVLNKAIDYYEKVLALQDNLLMRYKLAVCQYGLKRNGESMANIDKILGDNKAPEQKITITYESSSQEVSVLAAALNVGGIILIDQSKLEDAKLYLESALKMDPDFVLAKNNLQVVTGMLEKGK
jgi:tetratricopeptide (TPR) repeat protein